MINSCWLWLPLLVLNTPQPYKKDAVQFWTTSLCLCFVAEGCRAVPLPAGISGVCSVAGRVGVERALVSFSGFCSVAGRVQIESFLEVLPWSCGLFPMEPIARNAARQDVDKQKEFTSANHEIEQISALTRMSSNADVVLCFFFRTSHPTITCQPTSATCQLIIRKL